ncbi:hypothetical protein FPCIR_7959 [Fusarium pseudocircinatum]|uniref:Fungal N-terminal domain-containing protein n=1 Tax=Fusarium pseudocircinatum TaxID=56676 RepID=A0A8H5L4Q8_9HYPO|nr:hypothetical protein FPCIR_7959 [Fusarium pseudocircinatum]
MAEAFGIAGSAFGTVSLGLQLFKEISQYLDDIDGREEDLKEARSYATNIQLSLNALDIAISNTPTGDPATKNAIDSCKASCVHAANHLLAVVKELRGPISSSPNSNAAKAQELYAKLKYPFKKQNMEKLEKILSRTNIALQTILQVFQLNTGHAMTSAFKNMHQAVAGLRIVSEKNKTALDVIRKTSQLHDDRLGTIQQDVKELLFLTRASEDAKLLLRAMTQQVSDLTSRHCVDANLLQNPASDSSNPSIQTTSYQGGGSMTFDAFCSCKTRQTRFSQHLFQMLSVVTKPATYPRRGTAPEQVATALLSNYNESVGHCHRDWALSWWRRNGFASGSYTLFQSFPQVAESLEFGPLSQAIVQQDRNGVQQLLQRYPSHINEINYCGQSPIHLAIETQNMDIIGIILHYANAEALNAMDNMGRYPIALATTAIGKHTGWVQEDRGGFKTLELGFMPSRNHGGNCTQGHKILIKGLAQRREGLKALAYQKLSPSERQDLRIHQSKILDKNAARVQHQLEAQGYEIPTYLKVYEANTESPKFQISIYSYICSGEVAEYARQLGFHYSSIELADYIFTLATRMGTADCRAYMYTPFSCSYFCWMIGQGANVSSSIQSKRIPIFETELTIAHYFMASHGMMVRGDRGFTMDCPMSLEAFKTVFSDTLVDGCRCWCSPRGCTPLAKLLGGIHWFEKSTRFSLKGDFIDRLIGVTENLIAGLFSTHTTKIDQYQWIYTAIVRYYTSAILDLPHVCCCIIQNPSGPLPEEERWEFQEEYSFLLELFESLISEFEDELRHEMRLGDFFEWMRIVWAPRMGEAEQELASRRLTSQQLQDAVAIGVVLKFHGHPSTEPSSRVDKPAKGDLWDAMDELDKIATDPERPTKESLQTHT